MGLLTILKKMKHKEREMRLLMLYPFLNWPGDDALTMMEINNERDRKVTEVK